MGMISVSRLQSAMGVTFSDTQATAAQYFIDVVSAYIETETGVSFSLITGAVVREEADGNGRIELTQEPIQDVDSVVDFQTSVELTAGTQYRWNGINTLKGFYPFQVVDITLDYGYSSAPADVVGVLVEAVKRGLATGNLPVKQQTVGDVTVIYGDLLTFSKSDMEILGRYGQTETTWGPPDTANKYGRTRFYPWTEFTINGPDYECL